MSETAMDANTPATPANAATAAGARAGRRRPSIPGYRIIDVLGEGGMGTVYAGEQDQPRRPVAIKVLHATSDAALARFNTEAEIMARLDHPGIAKAYGTVAFENGVATVTGGYNVTSASDTGSAREVTLAITMADTNYVVDVTGNGGGAPWAVTGKTTTKFTVDGPTEASGRTFSFKVHGQRTT